MNLTFKQFLAEAAGKRGEYPGDQAEKTMINQIIQMCMNNVKTEANYEIAYSFLESKFGGQLWDKYYELFHEKSPDFEGPQNKPKFTRFKNEARALFKKFTTGAEFKGEPLAEAFDSDVDGTILQNTPELFRVRAIIAGRQIRFMAALTKGEWDVVFIEHGKTGSTTSKTGSGGAMEVFSFVMECIKKLIELRKPEVISFTSEVSDENRTSLYTRLAKRYTPKEYEVTVDTRGTSDLFTFKRKGAA